MKKLNKRDTAATVKNIAAAMHDAAKKDAKQENLKIAEAKVGARFAAELELTPEDLTYSKDGYESGTFDGCGRGAVLFAQALEARGLKPSKQSVAPYTSGAKIGKKNIDDLVSVAEGLLEKNGFKGDKSSMYRTMLSHYATGRATPESLVEKGEAALMSKINKAASAAAADTRALPNTPARLVAELKRTDSDLAKYLKRVYRDDVLVGQALATMTAGIEKDNLPAIPKKK